MVSKFMFVSVFDSDLIVSICFIVYVLMAMAQASLFSTPFKPVRFASPKRNRLSLKRLLEQSPPKEEFTCRNEETLGFDDLLTDDQENLLKSNTLDVKNEPSLGDDEFICTSQNSYELESSCNDENVSLNSRIKKSVDDEKPEVSALGLPNCGNTCYLNSILQVLRYTPNFLYCLHKLVSFQVNLVQITCDEDDIKASDFFSCLHTLYQTMKKQERFLYKDLKRDYSSSLQNDLKSFLHSLREISSVFEEGEQHDAHEFLLTVVHKFDSFSALVKENTSITCDYSEVLNASIRPKKSKIRERKKLNKRLKYSLAANHVLIKTVKQTLPSTAELIFDLGFQGSMQFSIKCLECETKRKRSEPFNSVEVTISDDFSSEETIDLCQCLIQKTIVGGENKYFCEDCCHPNEAQLSSEIVSLPTILILHCSWLKQSSKISDIEKDNRKVAIPLFLKTNENPEVFCSPVDATYSLYAVVFHIGSSVENGHYVTAIKEIFQTKASSLLKNSHNFTDLTKGCIQNNLVNWTGDKWLLFDDETVSAFDIHDSSVLPYQDFMMFTASPCIIFYHKM